MENINTGVSSKDRGQIAEGLAGLLANTYTLYLKTQSYHWNVTGPTFHSLHTMFETQYQDLANAADEIAERIRALGSPAPGSYSQFQQLSKIKEDTTVPKWEQMVQQLLVDNEMLIQVLRGLLPLIEEIDDEVTLNLLADRMTVHEKTAWMLRSTLG